jgi:hypothetical protein
MDFGESAFGVVANIGKVKCPFKVTGPEVSKIEPENPPNDDKPAARRIQENNGGTLGDNLNKTSPDCDGAKGTVNDVKRPPKRRKKDPKRDSSTDKKLVVRVKTNGKLEDFPFKVAAHHLIPGNAALKNAQELRKFMEKGKKITTVKGRKYSIKEHIGYNINGAHNGVWLPGNYGIRKGSSPKKRTSWGGLANDPKWEAWCYEYMIKCTTAANGQFHDSHPTYSENVMEVLEKIADKLGSHLDDCNDCKGNAGGKIYPPYFLKNWLYAFSGGLRTKCKLKPPRILFPWCTSDAFSDQMRRQRHATDAPGFIP